MHRALASTRAGFTVIEMIIVLTLASVVVTLAMPRMDAPERRLTAGVRETWATLLAARQQAVLRQHDVLVEVDTAAGVLRIVDDADSDGVVDAGEPVRLHPLEGLAIGRGAAPAGPIGAAGVSFATPPAGEHPRLVFHRNGSASEFGGFYLRTPRAESASHSDEVRIVSVERATGRVSSFHRTSGGWERSF